ncbi:chaperonin [Nymphon striatum]|nr:chaperonin [Nymphon striatum]
MTQINVAEGALQPARIDEVIPFQIDDLDARGRAVLLGPSLTDILGRHDYPEPVARLLGEMVVLTVLLGTSLKFSGKMIVQSQTNGPVSLLVVDFVTPDSIRAYARFDADKVATSIEEGKTQPTDMLGTGLLAITVDQGEYMNRYQGVVQLDGSSLEEIARNYFKQSEQIPTEVRMAVGKLTERTADGETTTTWHAPEGAQLPEPDTDDDDAWLEVKALIGTIGDDELLDEGLGAHGVLYRLFHERGVRVFDGQKVVDKCSCSREKVADVLKSFSAEQRA